ncbi:hypothetical protein JB92DRAFT_795219 [Gautieria morchelliformis]|nr:hypothetical protein JB92DRAFT_795219 [Gautieria morchelliformis]
MKIISRTSNRTFVGAPLCRDPEFAALNFTIDVVMGSQVACPQMFLMLFEMRSDILNPSLTNECKIRGTRF